MVRFWLRSVVSLFITGLLIILFGTRAETMLIFFRSGIVHCNSSILRLRITVSLAPGDVLGVTAVNMGSNVEMGVFTDLFPDELLITAS